MSPYHNTAEEGREWTSKQKLNIRFHSQGGLCFLFFSETELTNNIGLVIHNVLGTVCLGMQIWEDKCVVFGKNKH